MAKITATVPVTVSFEEDVVLEDNAFYKKVTPHVVIGRARLEDTNVKAAIMAELAAKKRHIKLGTI